MNSNNVNKPGLEGILKAYDETISHYDFVLNDLSSEIYDPTLQAQKVPVIAFLSSMRAAWQQCRDDAQKQLDHI